MSPNYSDSSNRYINVFNYLIIGVPVKYSIKMHIPQNIAMIANKIAIESTAANVPFF